MKAVWLILGLLIFVNVCKSFVAGQLDTSLRSSVVNGVLSSVLNVTQWTVAVVNMAQWTAPTISSLYAEEKSQTTIMISNATSDALFTKTSNEQIPMPVLSTTWVTKDLLNSLIGKSVVSRNAIPENAPSRTPPLNTHSSTFKGKENNFAISSIPSVVIPEIVPSQFQATGIVLPPSSGDNIHLATSQGGDKSLIDPQEAFTKSAFLDPPKRSREFNLQTAQFASSKSILVQINSYAVRTNDDTKLFTNGSVSLTFRNLPRTFPLNSTAWKTADLKSSSLIFPLKKETQSFHNTQTLETKIITAAPVKENFSGIFGISKTTIAAKMTAGNQDHTSPSISALRGSQIPATSFADASVTYGLRRPQANSTFFTSSLTASPIVSRTSQTFSSSSTVTISTTPLVHLSVTNQIRKTFSLETEKEFSSSTKRHSLAGEDGHEWSAVTHRSNFTASHEVVSLKQSTISSRSPTSKMGTLASSSSRLVVRLQSLHSLSLQTSEVMLLTSSPVNKIFPTSTSTENIVRRISVSSTHTVPQSRYSSPWRQITLHVDSVTSDKELGQKTISRHQSLIHFSSPAIDYDARASRSSQNSLVSSGRITQSFSLVKIKKSHNTEVFAVGSSSDIEYNTGYSSSSPPATSLSDDLRKPSSTTTEGLTLTSKISEIRLSSSSQNLFVSTEMAVPSTYPTSSQFQTSQKQSFTSYLELSSSVSKIRLSSSQSAHLSTKVAPSSTWQSRFQDPHNRASSADESQRQSKISLLVMENQTAFSAVSTEFVVPSYMVSDYSNDFSNTSDKKSYTTYQQTTPSHSKAQHKISSSPAKKSEESTERVTATLTLWNHPSYILHNTGSAVPNINQRTVISSKTSHEIVFSSRSSPLSSTPVTPSSPSLRSPSEYQNEKSSISPPGNYSTTSKQIRLSSSESLATSTELSALSPQSLNHFQTPQKKTSVATSVTHKPLPSPSITGHHARLSSFQSLLTSAKLVAPSSHTKSNSHVSLKRSSSASTNLNPRPSVNGVTSTFEEKLQTTSAFDVVPSKGEFESKTIVYPVPGESLSSEINNQLDTTVTPTETNKYSNTEVGTISTAQPTTATVESDHIKLLLMVAIVPCIVLCICFAAVIFFRRSRRRRNNFKYSIKLEYRDENNGFRSRCVNSRLDLSLKGIHIDLELPNAPANRAHSRDSTGYSRGPSFAETQMRELQFLSQECKENLEWISEVLARDMETSICGRSQPVNRESVYSVKEKGSYEPGEKIIRRESSKRGRETVKWRVPIVRRRDSEEFDHRDSMCTEDTSLTPDLKNDRETGRATWKNIDKSRKGREHLIMKENKTSVDNDVGVHLTHKNHEGSQRPETEKKERELGGNVKPKKDEVHQVKRTGKRFETL